MTSYADVALHLPVDQTFTYAVPRALQGSVVPGARVLVPFQSRVAGGTCVAVGDAAPAFQVRPILRLVDERPLFTPVMLRVARWIGRRYGAGIGEALDAALPFAVRTGGGARTVLVAQPLVQKEALERILGELEATRPKQARALRILCEAGESMEARDLMAQAKVSESPLRTLARQGLIALRRQALARESGFDAAVPAEPDLAMTAEQAAALLAVTEAVRSGRHRAFLLFGITGSGKTEVYLQALRAAIAAGRQAIVLVPEIALTPQTVARFRARFGRVAVLHSHLTDAERNQQWRLIQRGDADVVIGARSAIFAPLPRLGLIIVDEEHEGTFKQQNAPRYDAREVARVRARLERAVLVLGSATPSLEAWHRAQRGRLDLLRLRRRVAGGSMPETLVADLNATTPVPGRRRHLTDRLCAALIQHVGRGEQVILFLNRRGYATAAICRGCGAPLKCENCDIVLVYHQRIGRVLCHYCAYERRLPPVCDQCHGVFRLAGFGTERIEEEVKRLLPTARVARMDSDTMRARGSHEAVLAAFRRGAIDVLVGTQMIAKGLDFPNVTLVGVVSADTTLNLPDYRAAERTFNLVAQVSGRAGRGAKGGSVIVQTQLPGHYAIQTALAHDYERFAALELDARRKDGYPPFGHLARVVVEGAEEALADEEAEALRQALTSGAHPGLAGVTLLGPAPAPIAILNGRHRRHLVAKARYRSGIQAFVSVIRGLPRPRGRVRRLLDVDPYSML